MNKEELKEFYDEYESKFPEWYIRKRRLARKIYEEYEARGSPIGNYGKDFDLTQFNPSLAPAHSPLESLSNLDGIGKERIQSVGQRPDEEKRTGSHLQQDTTPTYLSLTELAKKELLPKYPKGLTLMNWDDAICKHQWLERWVNHIVPINLDKYTAWNSAYSIGGVFVWVKERAVVEWPIQACFYLQKIGLGQLVRIMIIAEPFSKVHLITGCVMHPGCTSALHGCITEVWVGKGAEVTLSIIHNFRQNFHIRPKVGVIVDEGGTYRENYILTSPVESTQLYPTIILRERGARASMRSLVFGRGKSAIDVGTAIIFTGEDTRGEIMSRSVVTDESTVKLRGALKAYRPNVRGHLDCRALILSDKAQACAYPNLRSISPEADLTHEAAIRRIADKELFYLMSRGLTKEEATSMVTRGFMDTDIPGLPKLLQVELNRLVSMTAKEVM
jgi:hypothetical protein